MLNKSVILFDLDGTLTDNSEGIIKSVQYALSFFGIDEKAEDLKKFIGPPLKDSFMQFYNKYNFNEEKAEKAISLYRERFSKKGLYENTVYDGVFELLERLKNNNKTIALATSKPIEFSSKILEYLKLDKYFDFLAADTLKGERDTKAKVIEYAITMLDIKDLSQVVMVGDREFDIIGAKQQGIESIGVLYGFGDENELKTAGADYICNTVAAVGDLILL